MSSSGYITRITNSLMDLLMNRSPAARILFKDGATGCPETPEQNLLRRRIRIATVVMLLVKVALMIRNFVTYGAPPVIDYAIVVALIAATGWLYSPRNASLLALRTVETIIFLALSAHLGLVLNEDLKHSMQLHGKVARGVWFVAAIKDQIIATFGMMMIYGMFIPNRARRAALMVSLMAVVPAIVIFIAINQDSASRILDFRDEHFTGTGIFTSNLIAVVVGAACAVYGTAMMNRWRNRAIEAEELGQYQLGEKIGSGGMGDVYVAEHRLLKRLCAVKVIRADLSEDPVMLGRFEREVQATACLTHWNTVQVFDYGKTVEGTFFYVMEHLNGRNLRQVVTETGPMDEERVIFILKQVCNALREAAARGLVHRDIKPSNVFLAHAGERFDVVKLLDFGLVRPLGTMGDADLSGANQIKGSPRYMCPEQAQGQTPDVRGDLYSLGATAYFLLSGRPPFDLQNSLKLVIAHATEQPPTFAEIGASVSPELETIVMRCLEKQPDDRFQTPDEILTALEEISGSTPWSWKRAETWWKQKLPEVTGETLTLAHDSTSVKHESLDETVIDTQLD